MIRLIALMSILSAFIVTKADNYIESFNIISNDILNDIQDVQIIRSINGGTVITPTFDESCPEDIKAPFSYACKIVEEYLPPCLPLQVRVSCGRINSSSNDAISKVLARSKENFGNSVFYKNAQTSVIKGVILAELCYNSSITYLDSVPDVEFLTKDPDIEITYNNQKLNEISFSLDPNPGEQYDFVSLAIRDLIIGLGISSSYRYNPVTGELLDPSHELTPFESYINKKLGNFGNPTARLSIATKGELLLNEHTMQQSLKLYAPTIWQNGTSLNYFIPQDDSCISRILSYNFCKGMVARSLSDKYSHFIFYYLLGWKPDFTVSSSGPSNSEGGSTSLLMPYNGSISFTNRNYGISNESILNSEKGIFKIVKSSSNQELSQYIESFHPFLFENENIPSEGISISILKKDGSWDLVKSIGAYIPDMTFNMSEWNFHYEEGMYARTIDGYLRARITTKQRNSSSGGINYNSTFFVIDYLPQKINLSYAFINSPYTTSTLSSESNNIRLYLNQTEGLDRIVLERLPQGSNIPSKLEITDFKKGFFDTTIDRTTTFTAVGYNDNGISRGLPITISKISEETTFKFRLQGNYIYVEATNYEYENYNYTITSVSSPQIYFMGISDGDKINISKLALGWYVLSIIDPKTGLAHNFKFKKQLLPS